MNVWIRKTRKKGTCVYCEKPIVNGEYQVVCQHYMKLKTGKTWWYRRSFHIQCWIDQGIAAIESKPVVETRGRKRAIITDPDRVKRTSILRRRASVVQRLKKEMNDGQDVDRLIHLGEMLNNLKDEIELVGGAPESWE